MKKLLQDYKAGNVDLATVLAKLKSLPYEDLGFAKLDTHREIRKGYPETIFCKGKTIQQISMILKKFPKDQNILLTKANKTIYAAVKKTYTNGQKTLNCFLNKKLLLKVRLALDLSQVIPNTGIPMLVKKFFQL